MKLRFLLSFLVLSACSSSLVFAAASVVQQPAAGNNGSVAANGAAPMVVDEATPLDKKVTNYCSGLIKTYNRIAIESLCANPNNRVVDCQNKRLRANTSLDFQRVCLVAVRDALADAQEFRHFAKMAADSNGKPPKYDQKKLPREFLDWDNFSKVFAEELGIKNAAAAGAQPIGGDVKPAASGSDVNPAASGSDVKPAASGSDVKPAADLAKLEADDKAAEGLEAAAKKALDEAVAKKDEKATGSLKKTYDEAKTKHELAKKAFDDAKAASAKK